MSGGANTRAGTSAGRGARHLYVHVPFCASRCGYCDFVTVTGHRDQYARYVDALLAELELERGSLAAAPETIYVGGGTPTYLEPAALQRLLEGLPRSSDVTVEANPETVTPELAELLADAGVGRVSLGVQSFQPRLLEVLDRRVGPADVARAIGSLRIAGFTNISLDLLYGIPGESPDDLDSDLDQALALEVEHLSCYELEAKPGTRLAHEHGAALAEQAEAMEGHFERVVNRLASAGYRWYETSNFARRDARDLRSQHNLAYWLGRDYLGLGIGAVSTLGGERRRNAPSLLRYIEALERGDRPAHELEALDEPTRMRERLMLGLRLDEPLSLSGLEPALERGALERLAGLGLVESDGERIWLSRKGRFVGGGVTTELISWPREGRREARGEALAA